MRKRAHMEIGSGQGAAKPARRGTCSFYVFYMQNVCMYVCVFSARKGRKFAVIRHYGN